MKTTNNLLKIRAVQKEHLRRGLIWQVKFYFRDNSTGETGSVVIPFPEVNSGLLRFQRAMAREGVDFTPQYKTLREWRQDRKRLFDEATLVTGRMRIDKPHDTPRSAIVA